LIGKAGQALLGIVACCYTPFVPYRYKAKLGKTAGPFRRALRYAFYDWTREMPRSKRIITTGTILIQGYAVYALWARSFIWPLIWPKGSLQRRAAWPVQRHAIQGWYCCNKPGRLTSIVYRRIDGFNSRK
jgi:hypothetical protein